MSAPAGVVVLGSTGSIGTQALDVIARHPGRFRVSGIAVGANAQLAIEQARKFGVGQVAVADATAADEVREALGPAVTVLHGAEGVIELAGSGADTVLNAITGSRALQATLAALDAGSRLALANKESLIVGGDLVLERAAPGQIVPVDSEHSAVAQCLVGVDPGQVARLLITASGGPFRGWSRERMATVTVEQAMSHPTWNMGPVITINSATLANKGLEVIEAHLLFGVDFDQIEVIVQPQSVVHSMVEFVDGAVIAKLSPPSMELPIQLALTWPDHLEPAPTGMDWAQAFNLTFEPVDHDAFPMVGLAMQAGRVRGTAPAVFNAANEEAVEAFLAGKCEFPAISDTVAAVLESHDVQSVTDVETLQAVDATARAAARTELARRR